jgi:hypothetical protein
MPCLALPCLACFWLPCAGYDPVGWGLPYGSFVATDTAKPLMESAVQVRTFQSTVRHRASAAMCQSCPHSISHIEPSLHISPQTHQLPISRPGPNNTARLRSSYKTSDRGKRHYHIPDASILCIQASSKPVLPVLVSFYSLAPPFSFPATILSHSSPQSNDTTSADGTALPYVRAEDLEAEGFNVFRKILGDSAQQHLWL